MKQLLITIVAVVWVGCGNREADRALLRAVSDESIDAMKAAIANGADINAKYKGKYKIYDRKTTNQFSNIVQWLCAKENINGNIGL